MAGGFSAAGFFSTAGAFPGGFLRNIVEYAMLCYDIIYCTYYTILYYTILYHTNLIYNILYYTILYHIYNIVYDTSPPRLASSPRPASPPQPA